jgi:signal transduction histidine kinase
MTIAKAEIGSRGGGEHPRSPIVDMLPREDDGARHNPATRGREHDAVETPPGSVLKATACDAVQLSPDLADCEDLLLCSPCQIVDAQEAERKRIATELHDGLGQSLGLIKFELDQAREELAADKSADAAARLDSLAPKIKGALDEVRRVVMNLRPSTLEDLGILATLSWFLREYASVYRSIDVEQSIDVRERDVPEALKLPLYRIVQEALNNTAKHARATRAGVRLRKQAEMLRLVVEDNGVGFDRANARARARSSAFGYAGIRDRVRLTGGRFAIETASGAGVRIVVTWNVGDAAVAGGLPPRQL